MSALAEPHGEILAAIKLDVNAPAIVRAAAGLAAASNRPLRLIHVDSHDDPSEPEPLPPEARADPYAAFAGWAENPEGDGRGRYYAFGYDATMHAAQQRLSELAKAHAPEGVLTHTTVVVGDYPETLCNYARTSGASLIVAGAPVKEPGLWKSKLRLTQRLMALSSVPVLILPDDQEAVVAPEAGRPLKVLLADDLTPSSLPAITTAKELVELLRRPVDVLHVHVEPLPTAAFALSSDYELEVWPGLSMKDRLINDRHEHLQERLRARARQLRPTVAGFGGAYATQLWHGNVAKEIQRAAEVHAADISIFGRHHFLHRQPLALGQMSFAAMLGVHSSVLVAAQ